MPSPLAGGMQLPPPPRASTSATPPQHPFASTSHAPYNFPELEAQPFLANFFSSLDDLPYFNPDQPLDYDANSAAATLAGVLANPHMASPVPSSSDVDEMSDNPFPFCAPSHRDPGTASAQLTPSRQTTNSTSRSSAQYQTLSGKF